MSKNSTTILIVAIVLLVLSVLAIFFEFGEVSAHRWQEKYDYEDEEPYGLYIFKELTTRYFDDVEVSINDVLDQSSGKGNLYIQFVPYGISDNAVDSLLLLAESGNDILIIADDYDQRIAEKMPQYYAMNYNFDSIFTFNFTHPSIASDTNYIYAFAQENKFDFLEDSYFKLLQFEDSIYSQDLDYIKVSAQDSMALMVGFPIGEGHLYYHMHKEMFYNNSYRQPSMMDYTQAVLAHFEPEKIYMLNPLTIFKKGSNNFNNPLAFIMSQPALKTAYYLLVLGTVLFVFFGGKRKQKIIPVNVKNKNTSLEYIETVSQLFFQQGQHEKLLKHMSDIFYHKMQKRFFIKPDHPNYVRMLSKKSRIPEAEIKYVLQRFKVREKNYRLTSDQLASINARLESIYNLIENKDFKTNTRE